MAHALDHHLDELVQAEGIGQQADFTTAAQPGHGQLLGKQAALLVFTEKAQRQQVTGAAVGAVDLKLGEQGLVRAAERGHGGQANLAQRLILAGEPASLAQVGRQYFAAQSRGSCRALQLGQRILDHQGVQLGQRLHRAQVPARHALGG